MLDMAGKHTDVCVWGGGGGGGGAFKPTTVTITPNVNTGSEPVESVIYSPHNSLASQPLFFFFGKG